MIATLMESCLAIDVKQSIKQENKYIIKNIKCWEENQQGDMIKIN